MRRDASSRILRRVAQRSPRSPGEALRRPGGASRGGAFKSREGEKKREFLGRAAKGKAAFWQTEITGGMGVARGGKGETLQKCVVTHFEARGPRGPLEAWRCAAVGASGALWNRGDAF